MTELQEKLFLLKIKTWDLGQQSSALNTILVILKEVIAQKLFVVVEQHCEGKG